MIFYIFFALSIFLNSFSIELDEKKVPIEIHHGRVRISKEDDKSLLFCDISCEEEEEEGQNEELKYLLKKATENIFQKRLNLWFLNNSEGKTESNQEEEQLKILQNSIYGLPYDNEIYNAIYSLSKKEKISLSEELTNTLQCNELFLKIYAPDKAKWEKNITGNQEFKDKQYKHLREFVFLVSPNNEYLDGMKIQHLSFHDDNLVYISWWDLPKKKELSELFFGKSVILDSLQIKERITLATKDPEFLNLLKKYTEELKLKVEEKYPFEDKNIANITITL